MTSKRTKVQLSIVSPTGYRSSTCGYCTAPGSGIRSAGKTGRSYGIWAHRLSPYHYQDLIDQGWRRSGDYIYKPDLARTCCPQVPIRLAADNFKPTKGQKRALTNLLFKVRQSKQKPAKWKGCWSRGRDWDVEKRWQEIVPCAESSSAASGSPHSAWADTVAGPITQQVEVKLALSSCTDEKYQVFRKYQAKVHGESEDDISSEKGFSRFLVDTSLALTWPSTGLPLSSTEETRWRSKVLDSNELPQELPFGCYHQEYRVDGKLIAVGVLDILPKCVSSVYLFYDPDFNDWQLGKISALQEIALTKQLARRQAMQDIHFYYMGYYIHNCQKMKYKAEYRPSQLLDCIDNTWHKLSEAGSYLDSKQAFGWSGTQRSAYIASNADTSAAREDLNNEDETERAMRVPNEPIPPPGMLNAQRMLEALMQLLQGVAFDDDPPGLDLLQHAMVLEAQNQAEGMKPLLMSDIFRNHVQSQSADDKQGSELVQAVECIAALSRLELVSQVVLFM